MSFKSLYYRVIAASDSYNDTTMLGEADAGILFHAPDNVIREFPHSSRRCTFEDLKQGTIKTLTAPWACNATPAGASLLAMDGKWAARGLDQHKISH